MLHYFKKIVLAPSDLKGLQCFLTPATADFRRNPNRHRPRRSEFALLGLDSRLRDSGSWKYFVSKSKSVRLRSCPRPQPLQLRLAVIPRVATERDLNFRPAVNELGKLNGRPGPGSEPDPGIAIICRTQRCRPHLRTSRCVGVHTGMILRHNGPTRSHVSAYHSMLSVCLNRASTESATRSHGLHISWYALTHSES